MRAVVLNGERDVSVEEVPDAGVPGPDGLLLRVERTAICGSDLTKSEHVLAFLLFDLAACIQHDATPPLPPPVVVD